jgi:hypothetical protein
VVVSSDFRLVVTVVVVSSDFRLVATVVVVVVIRLASVALPAASEKTAPVTTAVCRWRSRGGARGGFGDQGFDQVAGRSVYDVTMEHPGALVEPDVLAAFRTVYRSR